MDAFRREFLKLAGTGLAGATASVVVAPGVRADVTAPRPAAGTSSVYDVRTYGATGDGKTIDSPAIDKAIETAAAAGGYDPAEPKQPWESYQDYGHNHWHNSLIWGESINNFAILGPGLIWGEGVESWDLR